MRGLERLLDHPNVGDVRGKGLMALLEVVEDKPTKKSFDPSKGIGGKLQAATRQRGLIVRCNDTGMAISPPLVITEAEVDEMLNILSDSLDEVFA
jgi:4-aminobutyrate--pyruvate transaminase